MKKTSDAALRKMWREAGGSFHGPMIETGTMPESKLLPFLRQLISKGRREGPMRCWRVTAKGWESVFTMTTSAERARMRAFLSMRDVGYFTPWTDIKAVRSPEHDCLLEKHGAFSNLGKDWVAAMLAKQNGTQGELPL